MNRAALDAPIEVVIADDSRRSRDGLKALLSSFPDVVVVGEAADGWEAMHVVNRCEPDVLLIDARMPGMDGFLATNLIKRRRPDLRIVVLTMYAPYRNAALAAGANAFLVKGCTADQLIAAVKGG